MLEKLLALKNRLGPLWWYSGLMFVVSRLGNLIDFYIAMFVVIDVIPNDKLGAVLPLSFLSVLISVPLASILGVTLKYITVFEEAGRLGKVKALLRDLGVLTLVLTVAIVAYAWFARDFLYERLKVEDPVILWMMIGVGIVSCWLPVFKTVAQGLQKFYRIVGSSVVAPLARLVVVLLLIRRLNLAGYLAGTMAAGLAAIALFAGGLRHYLGKSVRTESYREDLPGILRYMVPICLMTATAAFQAAMEPWIIRQRLPVDVSAGFYTASMFGRIPMFIAGAIMPFLFPLVSARHERGESTRTIHLQSLAVTFGLGAGFSLLLLFAGAPILRLRPSWARYVEYAPFIWQVGLIYTGLIVAQCHFNHENACRRFRYLRYYVPIALLEVGILYALMGWPAFKPMLPEAWWNGVNAFIRRDLTFIVRFVLTARMLTLAAVGVDAMFFSRPAEPVVPKSPGGSPA